MARVKTARTQQWSAQSEADAGSVYWVYCIAEEQAEETGPCKVGVASNLEKRLSSLQGGNYRRLVLCWSIKVSDRQLALDAESYCLSVLRPSVYGGIRMPRRLMSEWVDGSPAKALEQATRIITATIGRPMLKVAA